MGTCCATSFTGLIYNGSHFPLYYSVYDCFVESSNVKKNIEINPNLKINTDGAEIAGAKVMEQYQIKNIYAESIHEVPPQRFSTLGLQELTPGKQKLNLGVIIKGKKIPLCSGIILKTIRDANLKIRRDLSFKHFDLQRAQQIKTIRKQASLEILIKDPESHLKGRLPNFKAMKPQQISSIIQRIQEKYPNDVEELTNFIVQRNQQWKKLNPQLDAESD